MRRTLALAAALALGAAAPGRLAAQPAAAQPAADPVYDQAFADLIAGRLSDAIAGFDQVAADSGDPERRAAARELARLARTLQGRGLAITAPPAPAGPGGRAPTAATAANEDDLPRAGRVEVVSASTLAGFYSGFALSAALDVDDFRTGALLVTATTGGAFAASLLATRDARITNGTGAAYGLGLLWGTSNGLLLASPLGVDSGDGVLAMGLGGLVVGGTAGLVLGRSAEPTPAQVSFAGTLSILGFATSGLGLVVVQPDVDSEDAVLLTLAAGLDLGAAAGVAIAPRLRWSNARSNLTALSAFLGAVGGFGVAAIVGGEPEGDGEGRAFAAATLGGMWGGFALGAVLTRDMAEHPRFSAGAPAPPVAVTPTVVEGGYGLSVAGAF